MKKVLLKIGGMTCSACSSGLEKYLNKQEGVISASVNLVMNNANIQYDENKLDISSIEKFIKKAGFESLGIDNLKKEVKKEKKQKFKLIGLGIISAIIIYIGMGRMIGLPSIPYVSAEENPKSYAIIQFLLALIACVLGSNILKNGYKNLIHSSPNMDTLVGLGVLSSMIYSIYGSYKIFQGDTTYVNNLYYESSVLIIFFMNIGRFIEGKNKDKTKEAIESLMLITPKYATILRNGKEEPVTIDEIKHGDFIVCRPGEKIAVDGTISEGTTHIDESFITGESKPSKKTEGMKVVAGSVNYDGTIIYKAEKVGKESTISEIVKLVVEATSTKAPIAKVADKISGYFVPIIIIIAIMASICWLVFTKDYKNAINTFITVLVVACPCSLGLATPLSIVIAEGEASKKGILIKNAESLENAHKVKSIIFDKTGTLTNGKLKIDKIINYSNNNDDITILQIIASIEKKSEHPIAKGIVREAEEKKIELKKVKEFKSIQGLGVEGKIDDIEYIVGNRKFLNQKGIVVDEKDEISLAKKGSSILYLANKEQLLALVGIRDTIRSGSKENIEKLEKQNMNVVMLTGDNEVAAKTIAKEIGIENVIAGVLPKDKAEEIDKLKNDGPVMMCGDGINDSIALVRADIGVSMSTGTDIAIGSSSIVLMNNDIGKINDLIFISKATIKNIKQNLFWAFFYNLCMLPIAVGTFSSIGFTINPMIASIAMTLSSICVTINSLRLKKILNKKQPLII